jgi:glycosyltransferase 2 family protein
MLDREERLWQWRPGAPLGPRAGRLAIVGVKASISVGLIALLGSRLDYARLLSYWQALNGAWILGALGVLLLEMCVLAGIRMKLMLFYVDAPRGLTTTARISLSGFFFEQVTIGFVGGDAMRLWLLRRADVPFGRAVQALLFDRAIGFAGIALLSLLGVGRLLPLLDDTLRTATVVILVAGGVAAGVALAAVLAVTKLAPLSRLATFWRNLGPRGRPANIAALALVIVLAIATHLLNVLVFWMLGRSLGLTVTFAQWFIVAPTVLFISMLPISVGGWGVREGVMVVALHGLGIPAEEAILPPILFGLCAAVASLPGGLFWIADKNAVGKKAG